MKRILVKTALFALAAVMPVMASAQAALDGHWVNPKGSVVVRLAPCGNVYCGTVVEASEKAKASARNGGTPSLVGTRILSGLHPDGNGSYKGIAFDPKHNIRAPATIRLIGPDALEVRGCALAGMFICKEQRWTRVS